MTPFHRIRNRLSDERGSGLVMAVSFMAVLTVVSASVLQYGSRAGGHAVQTRGDQIAYALGEAGINNAIAVLFNSANNPQNGLLLPQRTDAYEGGTVTWGGSLSGSVWTMSATAAVPNPNGGAPYSRTVTRTASTAGDTGTFPTEWDRIYSDKVGSSCDTLLDGVVIPSPFAARGNLCVKGNLGNGQVNAKLTGPRVWVGGTVEFDVYSSIGKVSTPIPQADIAGTCKFGSAAAHTPCSAVDKVYASTITASPTGLVMPVVDWDYWYENAKPGPKQGCTTGSYPGQFDTNTTFDKSLAKAEITPPDQSYSCKVFAGGTLVGELSWNHTIRAMTIFGTIFFDGDIYVEQRDGAITNYYGRGTIMTANQWKQTEVFCAGSGNCLTNGMANWNPSQNLLVVMAGGKAVAGHDDIWIHNDGTGSQGVFYGVHRCKLNDEIDLSGPFVCGEFNPNSKPTFYTWPSLGQRLATIKGPAATLTLGPQYG